jgi:penicillin-insensitive murein DD-endopeptidase
VPKSVRLALAALALAALHTSTASAAPGRSAHGRAHPGRRARLEAPAGRARAMAPIAPKKAEPAPKPAESVGSPNEGRLEGGVHLDLSRPYFRVVPAYASGDVRWGLPAMIHLIDRAAKTVNKRFPGSVLDVGDISQKGGGDLLRHHSHESGRDADLGFYATDAKGRQIHGHGFIKFDAELGSPTNPGARFDLGRNWLLVEEMLTDPAARVSHIFVAAPIRQRLLAFARTRGASRALLDRAQVVMMQPTTSLPHDDHFHVRISCPAMHGSCIELAKNAPHGHRLLAHNKVHTVLHTPHLAGKGPAQGKMHPPPAAGMAPADPYAIEGDAADDAEADSVEVKDAVDETGTVKITD